MKISAEELRALLDYDPETGVFRWRERRGPVRPGDVAGTPQQKGYIKINVRRNVMWAHRLAWLYVHGEWPKGMLDHVDGNPANNAIANLRVCCSSKNTANSKRRYDNTTGFKGVFYRKDTGKFAAYLTVNYRRLSLGCFSTAEEAHAAYVAAAVTHFGEFARAA